MPLLKVLLTGASGRIGRAIHARLAGDGHDVVGFDRAASSTASVVASLLDMEAVERAMCGVDAVVHAAALHAPHVGIHGEREFEQVNVEATATLVRLCRERGVRRFVFTSTTALYGAKGDGDRASWVTEETVPQPRTIYHRTKLAAEALLAAETAKGGIAMTALRMSRCFPEPPPVMAVYRLHRGVDARDVADAHALALVSGGDGYRCYVISARTPFVPEDAKELFNDAPAAIHRRAPELAAAFKARGWGLPARIDRVYDSSKAVSELGWNPRYGFRELLDDGAIQSSR